jgi:co-chaperonin GroES (HSP10)
MKSIKGTYLLSMIDHKATHQLTDEITLEIDKSFENNLRERNPQLGKVEAIPDDNFLKLEIGDTVAVQHFTFYGDIGTNKSFALQPHVKHDGKLLFKAHQWQIFFKYNNNVPEPLDGFILCDNVEEDQSESGIILESKPHKNKAIVTFGHNEFKVGDIVLVLDNALYSITLDKKEYFKVRTDEVVAKLDGDKIIPVNNNMLIEYLPEKESIFDLSFVKKTNNLTAKKDNGDLVQVYRNQGVKYGDKRIISEDMIAFNLYE